MDESVKDAVRAIRNAVCALGVVPYDKASTFEDGPEYQIYGTGFLVDENLILTNRHVVQKLKAESQSFAGEDTRALFLLYQPAFEQIYVPISFASCSHKEESVLPDPMGDWAIVEIALPEKLSAQPWVKVQSPLSVPVGQDVAAWGYLFGTDVLYEKKEGDRVRLRYGPLLQRGSISAIIPHDECSPEAITELCLDLKSGPCMSGAPVFCWENGQVIGMIHCSFDISTHKAATQDQMVPFIARSIPVDQARLSEWINFHRSKSASGPVQTSLPAELT